MEPEQRPGSNSGPPNIQTTAHGQPFTAGSETSINSSIILPRLDLLAETRETPTALDGPGIKENNVEVTTDVDERQRIYILGDYSYRLAFLITQIV